MWRQIPPQKWRPLNIVFLDITYVLYCGPHEDKEHTKRMNNRGAMDRVKSDPRITRVIPSSMVGMFSPYNLSAVLGLSAEAINNLCRLCEENDAKLVISSRGYEVESLAQLKMLLSISHLSEKYILDSIPSLHAREVNEWLLQNQGQVNSFIILDGRDDVRGLSNFGERRVYCDTLFSEHALFLAATELLKKPLLEYKKFKP